jgi:adenylylsulfate kinase-like enzyme
MRPGVGRQLPTFRVSSEFLSVQRMRIRMLGVHSRRRRATPVLWLFGPPGVGKSRVGWDIYRRLSEGGHRCAYVDIDQLGMCYPEPDADQRRYRLKDRNLGALVTNFADTGASAVVVSGVVDHVGGTSLTDLMDLDVALCRLRADPDRLRQRLLSRRGSFAVVEDAIAEAMKLDASRIAKAVVDTTDLTIGQTVHAVLQTSGWVPDGRPSEPVTDLGDRPPSSAGGQVTWLCGPSGVGKSTIGFALYLRLLRAGRTAGYIDADQVGFCAVDPHDHWLKARNLAAIWENYRSVGAETLVAVGPVADSADASVYETVLPQASFKWFRLHSGPGELARRIETRQQGGSWPQPGDPLRGAALDTIQRAAEDAAAQATALDRLAFGTRVDTDRMTVEESAGAVLRQAD